MIGGEARINVAQIWMVRTNNPAPTISNRLKPSCRPRRCGGTAARPRASSGLLLESFGETRIPELQGGARLKRGWP